MAFRLAHKTLITPPEVWYIFNTHDTNYSIGVISVLSVNYHPSGGEINVLSVNYHPSSGVISVGKFLGCFKNLKSSGLTFIAGG